VRICLVSNARLPVRLYGGIERMVQWLAQEFLRAGHAVTVVARSGSELPGVRMVAADDPAQALARIPADVDIVHFHGWPPPDDFPQPWLFTLHGNAAPGETLPAHTVGISADHARRHGLRAYLYNGVDPQEFVFETRKQDHLLFFSKVRRRVKGAARALRLARTNHLKLTVAGGYRFDRWRPQGAPHGRRRRPALSHRLGRALRAGAGGSADQRHAGHRHPARLRPRTGARGRGRHLRARRGLPPRAGTGATLQAPGLQGLGDGTLQRGGLRAAPPGFAARSTRRPAAPSGVRLPAICSRSWYKRAHTPHGDAMARGDRTSPAEDLMDLTSRLPWRAGLALDSISDGTGLAA
jgi:glycosyltransferase involved in cell wall biosynthesis